MSSENPTSDLSGMLELGAKVDRLYLYVSPGFYFLNVPDNDENVKYSNVTLDGTWCDEGTDDMVRIDFKGIEFINSNIQKVSFSGNATISGGIMKRCESDMEIIARLSAGNCYLYNCEAKGFNANNHLGGPKSELVMVDCTAREGYYGLRGQSVYSLVAKNCEFSQEYGGGVNIDGCKKAYFENCNISFNSGLGAIRLIEFSNEGEALFSKCQFIHNNVTDNNAFNFFVHSNVSFYDCLFIGNTEKDNDIKGIVNLSRPDFSVVNCTFIDNKGALNLEQYYPSKNQIINCVFWGNGKTNVYCGDHTVPLLNCAMDHGSGIPELDAQNGIILLTENNKGFKFTGTDVELDPNTSVLINRGYPRSILEGDLYYHPRSLFGATDIGCVEFASSPGLWQPDTTVVISTVCGDYTLHKAKIGTQQTFYGLFPKFMMRDGNLDIESYNRDFIYLDTMPLKPKVHQGKYLERHTSIAEGYLLDVLIYDENEGLWKTISNTTYKSAKDRPTVEVDNGKITFVKPRLTNKATGPRKKHKR